MSRTWNGRLLLVFESYEQTLSSRFSETGRRVGHLGRLSRVHRCGGERAGHSKELKRRCITVFRCRGSEGWTPLHHDQRHLIREEIIQGRVCGSEHDAEGFSFRDPSVRWSYMTFIIDFVRTWKRVKGWEKAARTLWTVDVFIFR